MSTPPRPQHDTSETQRPGGSTASGTSPQERAEGPQDPPPPSDAADVGTVKTVTQEDRPSAEAAIQQPGEPPLHLERKGVSARRGPGAMDDERHVPPGQGSPGGPGREGLGNRRAPMSGDMLDKQQEGVDKAAAKNRDAAGPPPDGS